MNPPRAVLDADISYSRVLHELMGRLATEVRLFDLIWSEDLLAEARAKLVERKGLTTEIADAWVAMCAGSSQTAVWTQRAFRMT